VIRVRPYLAADRPELLRLLRAQGEAHGTTYYFQDPDDPTTLLTFVAEEDGRLVAVVSARTMAEGFLTFDPQWRGPAEQWATMKRLYSDAILLAEAAGFKEVVAGMPSELRSHGRRLARELGFVYDGRDHLVLSLARPAAERAEDER